MTSLLTSLPVPTSCVTSTVASTTAIQHLSSSALHSLPSRNSSDAATSNDSSDFIGKLLEKWLQFERAHS